MLDHGRRSRVDSLLRRVAGIGAEATARFGRQFMSGVPGDEVLMSGVPGDEVRAKGAAPAPELVARKAVVRRHRSHGSESETTRKGRPSMTGTLDAFIRRASRMAEQVFNEDGVIDMFWLLEKANGEQLTLVTPVYADAGHAGPLKDVIAHAVREFCHEHDVRRYVQIAEVWTLKEPCNAREAMLQFGSLANHPQRREIVMLCGDDGREHVTATRNIVRPSTGRPYLEKLGAIDRWDGIEPRWLDLLPRRGAGSA
jgi:hypothetical protein